MRPWLNSVPFKTRWHRHHLARLDLVLKQPSIIVVRMRGFWGTAIRFKAWTSPQLWHDREM
jgi:hypothetical protein